MIVGFNLRDSLRSKRDLGVVLERNDRLEEVIDLIRDKYVDTVSNNRLYKDAISGILKSLDPHTVYIPAEDLQGVNEDLEGNFTGIGVEFSIVRDTIEVTSVIENGPSSRAGVQIGDQLIRVGDTVVAGDSITSDRIVHLLRGKQHSNVQVTLKRPYLATLKQVTITRDVINISSIEASIMLDSTTGYMKITRFSANTYKDFGKALKQLKDHGLKSLIIDLRENPGGYLNAATSIADEILAGDKLILYTKGLHTPKTEYKAGENGLFEDGRLAILIDEGSASASEILAGAIQDWDRGVIVGRRSFGKGLVQEQYQLADGSALRLTVAKYYTPSGRCVQRSFAKGRDAYRDDYEKRFVSGELTGNNTNTPEDTQKYYTSDHRVVYGGGGITPDVYVPYDTTKTSTGITELLLSKQFKATIWDYFLQHKQSLSYANAQELGRSFNGYDTVINNIIAALDDEARKKAADELSKPERNEYFKTHILAQIARYLYHDNGYFTIMTKQDDVVKKAREVLGSQRYSDIIVYGK